MSAVAERVMKTELIGYEDSFRERVLVLARKMHSESEAHRDMVLDEDRLIAQIKGAATNDSIYFRLAVREGEFLGGFFGMISTVFFSQELVAKDLAWFVMPDWRGGAAALILLEDFERWALARGVRKFFLGQSTGVQQEATARLYRRLGYSVVGINAVKNKSV